MLRFNAYV